MPIAKVGVTIGGVSFRSNNVSFTLNTHRDSTGMPILQNLQTTVMIQVDMYDRENLPFDTIRSLFELAKLPTGQNIRGIDVQYWADDAENESVCSFHFKGWITRFETYTTQGSNGILSLELCPVINEKTGANVTIDQE